MWSQHTTRWLPQSSKPPLHFQILSACHYCTLQEIPDRIFCGYWTRASSCALLCFCVYFNQRNFSQSKFHVLPTLELLVICVKMLVHQPHSRSHWESKHYEALAGGISHSFGNHWELMEQGKCNISKVSRENSDVSSVPRPLSELQVCHWALPSPLLSNVCFPLHRVLCAGDSFISLHASLPLRSLLSLMATCISKKFQKILHRTV